MTNGYKDGSAGAPVGTPALSALLTGYAARPPWKVAGVDYAVGVPAGTTLKDPASIAIAGVSVNATSHVVRISANNVTLNGYDFGLGGGWQVYISPGAGGTIIENSRFQVGSNQQVPINAAVGSGSLTIRDDTFDGSGGGSSVWALVNFDGSGKFVSIYNSFQNAPFDAIDFSSGTVTPTVKYNVFYNLGTASGSHPDSVQFVSSKVSNWVDAFNTIYQPNSGGMEGIQLSGSNGSTQTNTRIENNVLVAPGPSIEMSYSIAVIQDSGNVIDGAVVSNNYIDATGAYGPFYPPSGSNLTFTRNVNMKAGTMFSSPRGTMTSDVAAVKANPATGTYAPGAVIAISLSMDEQEFVTGTPSLTLNDGGTATYASGSGTRTLVFDYTVAGTDSTVPALGVTGVNFPTGSAIKDANGNPANLSGANVTFSSLAIDPPASTSSVTTGPVANPDSATTPKNQPVTISVLSNDTDSGGTLNPASVRLSAAPQHGTTTINPTTGAVTYTPATGYYGIDTFKYTVADSQNIRSSPAAVSVSVTGATGYADGATGVRPGTPQLPNILSGYAVRPPWEVAGVDYAVGVPSVVTLKDPTIAGNLPTGATYNPTTHTVTVTADNVTLTHLDFSLHGGTELVIGSNNVTVSGSKFVVGPNQGSLGRIVFLTTSAGNVSFLHNEFDGNNVAVTAQQGQTMMVENHGTFRFLYNYVHNTGGDAIDFSSGPQTDVIKYNLFANIGVNTAHADALQWYNSQINSSVVTFNTVYQNLNQPGPGMGALVPGPGGSPSSVNGLLVANDTIIQTGAARTGNFTMGFEADPGTAASHVVVHDLFVDPTGALNYTGSPWFPTGYYGDNLGNSTVLSNVINMLNGAQVPVPSVASKTSQGYYVYPDASGNSPVLSDVYSITTSPVSGVEMPGNKITFALHMDEAFTVNGAPVLLLNNGANATYAGGSGTATLTFQYTVGTSDSTVSTLAITGVGLPSGASVRDAAGNAANLSGAVVSFNGLGVDPPSPSPSPTSGTSQPAGTDIPNVLPAPPGQTPFGSLLKGLLPTIEEFFRGSPVDIGSAVGRAYGQAGSADAATRVGMSPQSGSGIPPVGPWHDLGGHGGGGPH
jgi:hypothetical protein